MNKALIVFLSLSNLCFGASYVMDLSSYSAETPDPGDGADGWVQSEPNTPSYAPRSFITGFGSGNGLSLGGYYNTEAPSASGITLSRSFSVLSSTGTSLTLDFAITDSETNWDADRNMFTISLTDLGGSEKLGLVFVASAQSLDPDADADAAWDVYLSVLGTMAETSFCTVFESAGGTGIYSLDLTTAPTPTLGLVDYNVGISAGNVRVSNSGSFNDAPGGTIEALKFGFDLQGDEVDGLGGNFMTIGNAVVAVPEPSGVLLLSSGVFLMALRRKRR
jgi:hypothetical protein